MNCYYHPHEPAVAQCVDCHKGLCQHCASKYEIPICDDCNNTMDFTIEKSREIFYSTDRKNVNPATENPLLDAFEAAVVSKHYTKSKII